MQKMDQNLRNHVFSSPLDEKQLELRLAPPGEKDDSSSSSSPSSYCINNSNNSNNGVSKNNSKTADGSLLSLGSYFSSSASTATTTATATATATATNPKIGTQKRSAQTSLVGWPPVRSFRRNLSTPTCSKPVSQSENELPPPPQSPPPPTTTTTAATNTSKQKMVENCKKGPFVKINMDGVAIGRKIDLHAYDCYENLSLAVDDLFRALLAAQKGSSEEEKAITGILDGTGEYTLVYEDNEGDRMLVGDVPWNMFVTTVKRLRVLKSSDLSALTRGNRQGKTSTPA